jgi:Glycosyl hydrolase family 10
MGQMRFVIPRPERLIPGAAEHAYLASGDGIPWECHATLADEALVIERDTRESGYLYFPWKVAGRGLVQLSSGSLMERTQPYNLPVELARGTLNRVRNQAHVWQTAGMAIPAGFFDALQTATATFAIAATNQGHPGASQDQAEEAIRQGLDAADQLSFDYAQQVLSIRRSQQSAQSILLGARLQIPPTGDAATKFLAAFNMAVAGTHWPDLEPRQGAYHWDATDRVVAWAHEQNLRLCVGPLLVMDKHALPDWLFLDDGFEEVQASVLKFIESVVKRFRGKVHLWHVTARMNQDGAFMLSEEQRLRLVVEAVDRVRAIDPRTPLVVSFNQPWAEYIARKDQELSPWHFADTLVRGELGLAGIGLEIHYGYWPGGTLPRDPLEVSRQLDRWSQIGVPLMIFLSAPSSMGADPLARSPAHPLVDLRAGGINPAWQNDLVASLLPILLAKSPVQAIVWGEWQDNQPHELSSSGLYNTAGHAKPALQTLIHHRRDLLG